MQYWEVVSKDGVFNLSKIKDVDGYLTDNAQLTSFIDYCTEQTNARYYDLIMYGHGNGVNGYGGDDLLNKYYAENPGVKHEVPATLTITALSDAFASTNLFKSGRKLEFIGMDACKMGNYEVAASFYPYADYYVASEEIIPGRGWNYYDMLNGLNNDSTMSSETFVSGIVDDYLVKYNRMGGGDKGKVSNFGTTNGHYSTNEFDIKLLCGSLLLDDYPNIKEKSREVLNILDESVVNSQQTHTNKGENFGGLYLYFPANAHSVSYSKDKTGADMEFINDNVNYSIEALRKMGISEEYDKLINLFALIQATGYRIGNDWVANEKVTYQDVVTEISSYDQYKSALNTVNQDPESEDLAKKVIEKQLADRVTKSDIFVDRGYTNKVSTDENGKKEITIVDDPERAVITVSKGDILLDADGTADVRVTADLDGNKVLLGRTELYSENVIEGNVVDNYTNGLVKY